MAKISKLNDIEIYTKALDLAANVYSFTKDPVFKHEYSLVDQIKRASISVAANIAEGYGRNTKKDFSQFLSISLGSANEIIAYLDFIKLQFHLETQGLKNEYLFLSRRIYSFRTYLQNYSR